MFTPNVLRRISTIVLFAFTSLTLQPLQAAVMAEDSNAPAAPDKSQRYGQSLEKIRDGLQVAKTKQEQGQSPDDDIALVRAQKAELDALEADVEADFAAVGQHLRDHNLPAEILARHEAALAEFQAKKNEFKQKFDAFEAAAAANDLEQRKLKLKDLADYMQAQQHKKAHTSSDPNKLPFRTPDSNVRPPIETVAAYKATLFKQKPIHLAANGSLSGITLPSTTLPTTPTEADLAETEDIQLTEVIKAQAQALDHNPVKIHNWVRNNIEFIPTYGSIQGADLTLQTKRGNAFDTASLEIALLRASGIPARYVYGTVQIPADKAMNWVGGVNVPEAAQGLLGQGGIPNIGLASGGLIKYIKLEHVWVEAWIDYVPSRGAINRTGDTWVPMDASYKQYVFTSGMKPKEAIQFDAKELIAQSQVGATINESEGWVQNLNNDNVKLAVTNYQTEVQNYLNSSKPDATVGDVLGTKKIAIESQSFLMGTLPFKVITTGAKFATIPENLRYKFQYNLYLNDYAKAADSPEFRHTLSLAELAGKKITLSFIPNSQADSDLIASYIPKAHADGSPLGVNDFPKNLPGYLIKLKAELRIDGKVVKVVGPYTMGQELISNLGLYEPGKAWEYGEGNRLTVGEYIATHVDSQGVSQLQLNSLKNKLAATKAKLASGQYSDLTTEDISGDLLYSGILTYFAANQMASRVSAAAADVVTYRKPSYGNFMTTLQTSYWFGLPRNVSFPGLTMDVDSFTTIAVKKDASTTKTFMLETGERLSAYEHLTPEKLFTQPNSPAYQQKGISAVKALAVANEQGKKIFSITNANLNSALPRLAISQEIKEEISNAVNAGKVATVSDSNVTVDGWTGVGYIISDPVTGAGAYKISGGDNGSFIPIFLVCVVTALAIVGIATLIATGSVVLGVLLAAWEIYSFVSFLQDLGDVQNETQYNQLAAAAVLGGLIGLIPAFEAGQLLNDIIPLALGGELSVAVQHILMGLLALISEMIK